MQNVVTLEKLFAQFCPDKMRDKLINPPMDNAIKHLRRNAGVTPEMNKLINLSSIDLLKGKVLQK